jgi:hypothetical protein
MIMYLTFLTGIGILFGRRIAALMAVIGAIVYGYYCATQIWH